MELACGAYDGLNILWSFFQTSIHSNAARIEIIKNYWGVARKVVDSGPDCLALRVFI